MNYSNPNYRRRGTPPTVTYTTCSSAALFGVRLDDTVTDVCPVHLQAELRAHLGEDPSVIADAPAGAVCGQRRAVALELARLDVERTARHAGYDVYEARLLESGPAGAVVLEHFEVTLEPQTRVDLFTAAAVAAERLAVHGYRVFEEFCGRGEHGSAVMSR